MSNSSQNTLPQVTKPRRRRARSSYGLLLALKSARTSAARADRRLRILLRSVGELGVAPLALIELDEEGRVREWSRGAEARLGWRRSEIRSARLADFAVAREERTLFATEIRAGDTACVLATRLVSREGGRIGGDVIAHPIAGGREGCFLFLMTAPGELRAAA